MRAKRKAAAERMFYARNLKGARRAAIKAQNLCPSLDGISQMVPTFQVHFASGPKFDGESDWYRVLSLGVFADEEEVKKQYKKLAVQLHPHKNKSVGSESVFQLISNAWSVLSDKNRKMVYDQKMRDNTFWTTCDCCRMGYEYSRFYLNHKLLRKNCGHAFIAVETGYPSNQTIYAFSTKQQLQDHNTVKHSYSTASRSASIPDKGNGVNTPVGCGSGSAPKKARKTKVTTTKCYPEHEEEKICNVFTVELESLECDICFMPFESEVYSCKNGHAACANCCIKIERKCPSCNESIGDIRCRAMEKILAGMTRSCRFKEHGCPETVQYIEARRHEEEACRYSPYRCPFNGCAYRGLLLYGHILDAHSPGLSPVVTLQNWEPFRAILHHDGKSVFLLLNGGDVLTGRSLSVVRVCPYPEEEEHERVEAMHTMNVEGYEGTVLSLRARGPMPFVRRLDGYKAKVFLLVPDAFWGSSGSVNVTVLP